jgi:NADPH:quinone reductase-like Zn-dependent oxidoreductase
MSMASPKGGFYAQYAAVKASDAAVVPDGMAMDQAGAMPADAITALTGLDEVLNLSDGQKVLILGAGGGIGHMAVQLAKRMGAAVLAVASGDDGVQLAGRLGADVSINGRSEDIAAAARRFAPDGLDAALLTAGGPAAEAALSAVRPGGRAAYPNGVEPVPGPREGISVEAYDGRGDPATIQKLTALIEAGPFHVHVARTFPLERAADAHRALETHYLGKLVLLPW